MAAESDLWDQIRNTGDFRTRERSVSTRLPFGILKRLDISWTARARGEGDSYYVIRATEHQPEGRVAAILGPEPSLDARLSKYAPAYEDYGTMRTVYLAHLAAGELVISGRTFEADDQEVGNHCEHRMWTPLITLPQDEALSGFESTLADVQFN